MFLRYILRLSSILRTCCWLVTFGVLRSSQNSPFLQVLSSIAFLTNPLARLHGYLTIAGVGTSLVELVWFSAADLARLASFKAHYNIVLLTYLLTKLLVCHKLHSHGVKMRNKNGTGLQWKYVNKCDTHIVLLRIAHFDVE